MGLANDIQSVLYTEEQLRERVKEMGAQITRDYQGKDKILLVSVLRGSYIFMADLSRAIDLPLTIDFMSVSSYGSGTKSSGQVEIKKDISLDLEGYHVIIVEDILDSGNTLYYLMDMLRLRKAASIRICTLMDKPERRVKPIVADYAGFQIPDAFVVGYGLDYDQKYRNLPYVGILKPEVYGG
jgi:hypoxanthine phosphoribosyltransferase